MPITLPEDSELDLNPKTITLSTFHTLLSHYETTVRNLARRKALAKATKTPRQNVQPKTKTKRTAEPIPNIVSGKGNEKEELSADLKKRVEEQVDEYWELDVWRYSGLREVVLERQKKGNVDGKGKEKGVYMTKEEIIKLVEWKLKHGVNRPTLLGLIKSNPDRAIQSATSSGFETLQSLSSKSNTTSTDTKEPQSESESESPKENETNFYPLQKSINVLTTPLRGVGPATASLLLSAASPPPNSDVPFYSDDTYLWVCLFVFPVPPTPAPILGDESTAALEAKEEKKHKHKDPKNKKVRPNGELNVKYNLAEYKALWEAVGRLRGRLNAEVKEGNGLVEVSGLDVERVALVLRHLELAGLGELAEGRKEDEEDADEDADEDEERRKRQKVRDVWI